MSDGGSAERISSLGSLLADDSVLLGDRAVLDSVTGAGAAAVTGSGAPVDAHGGTSPRDAAVRAVGAALVETGAADAPYVEAMLEREHAVSTFVGDGIALPHGGLAGAGSVHRDALALLRLAAPIDWQGERVDLVIGIAATGNGYIALLSRLALVLLDPDAARAIRGAATPAEVRAVLDAGERG